MSPFLWQFSLHDRRKSSEGTEARSRLCCKTLGPRRWRNYGSFPVAKMWEPLDFYTSELDQNVLILSNQVLLLLPVFWASYFNQYEGSECFISLKRESVIVQWVVLLTAIERLWGLLLRCSGPRFDRLCLWVLSKISDSPICESTLIYPILAYIGTLLSSWLISRFLDYKKVSVKNRIIYRYCDSQPALCCC